MADVKLMVMYPRPQDMETFDHLYQDEDVAAGDGLSSEYARSFETFEKLYQEERVPMIFEKLVGKTTFLFGTVSLWDRLKGIASAGYARVCGTRAPKCNRNALLSIAGRLRG